MMARFSDKCLGFVSSIWLHVVSVRASPLRRPSGVEPAFVGLGGLRQNLSSTEEALAMNFFILLPHLHAWRGYRADMGKGMDNGLPAGYFSRQHGAVCAGAASHNL
jgi:hypothetical protein